MTEVSGSDGAGEPAGGKGRRRRVRLAILGVAGIAAVAVLYVILHGANKPAEGSSALAGLNRGAMEKLVVAAPPKAAPTTTFLDAGGRRMTLTDLKGQVVVVNLWATWCGPCKIEMPTLAKLQAAYAGKPVKVVEISVDRDEDAGKARAFIGQHPPLAFYHDPQYAMAFALEPRVEGLPTTIIYGKDGLERARLAGDADWSTAEARKVIDAVLAE